MSTVCRSNPRLDAIRARGGELAQRLIEDCGKKFARSGAELRGPCPWRPGSDSNGLAVSITSGQWFDHVTAEKGDALDLLVRLEKLPLEGPDFTNRTVARAEALLGIVYNGTEGHADPLARWAALRGFSRDALAAVGAKAEKSHAVAIPMRNDRGEVIGHRRRRADGTLWRGSEAKVITYKGDHSGLVYTTARTTAPGREVYLVEGEADLLALLTADPDATAFATPSANPGRDCLGFLRSLLLRCRAERAIAFADNDKADDEWLARIEEVCRAADIPLAVAALPPEAKDLDDALTALHPKERALDAAVIAERADALAAWVEAALSIEARPLPTTEPAAVADEGEAAQGGKDRPPASSGSWGPIVAFDDEAPVPFPVEALDIAPWLAAFVREVSRASQTPSDLAGLAALSVIGAAGARVYRVAIREGGFTEGLNIWTATLLPPAARKSSVFSLALRPVADAEELLAEQMAPTLARKRSEKKLLEGRLKTIAAKAAKEGDADKRRELAEQMAEAELALADIGDHLEAPRLYGADCNQEGIAKRLDLAGGRFFVAEPEGTLLETIAGRFTDGTPAFEALLKAFDGDPIRVDRLSRSLSINRPALSMALAVQPDVLRGLAGKNSFRGRGFWGRMFFAMPRPTVGNRAAFTEEPAAEVLARYGATVRRLYMEDVPDGERIITPTGDASQAWGAFFDEIEPRHAPGGDLEALADWTGKLLGRVARVAGILHLARHGTDADRHPLDVETMEAAINIGRYLLAHAVVVFRLMGAVRHVDDAHHLSRWIIAKGRPVVSFREAWVSLKNRMETADALAEAFGELVDRGHLKEMEAEKPVTGRPPRPSYQVNPAILH